MTDGTTAHGRVRAINSFPGKLPERIGITLSGSEHLISIDDALRLANAIILTAVDGNIRFMQEQHDDA